MVKTNYENGDIYDGFVNSDNEPNGYGIMIYSEGISIEGEWSNGNIKIGKMIIGGYYLGCMEWCIMLGAIITECDSYDKMFRKPPNMEDDYKIKQMYENNIKRFLHETGDHITLLSIFKNVVRAALRMDYLYNLILKPLY